MRGLTGATVVVAVTLAGGGVWSGALTPMVVTLELPLPAAAFELTVNIFVAVMPGARAKGVVSRADALNDPSGASISLNASVKSVEGQDEVSAFFTFTMYSTVPPGVIGWADGVTISIGVFFTHGTKASDVVTLFDVLFAWLLLAAVTEDISVPAV